MDWSRRRVATGAGLWLVSIVKLRATVELTFIEEFIHTRHGVVPLRDSPIATGVATLTGMVDLGRVRAFCEAAGQRFRLRKIILFGSYAYGKPTADSDVDLLVIMPRTRERGKRMSVRSRDCHN